MQWSMVRRFTAEPGHVRPADEWATTNGRDFVNRTEHLRLAGLGLVPLDPEIAQAAIPTSDPSAVESPSAESRVVRGPDEGRKEMAAVAEKPAKKAKGAKFAGLSKAKLRTYLLEHTTIPDRAWNAAFGAPAREKGETREEYIRRVLA